MVRFSADDDLRDAVFDGAHLTGARFRFTDLAGARFDQSSLPGAVLRGVDLTGADVDGEIGGLRVNGVEVLPLVDAELDRRHPGRQHRRSPDPRQQLASFEAVQREWAAVLARADARPELRDVRVDGEWSLAQTLRHLVFATDGWLRHAVLRVPDAFCPFGLPFTEYDDAAARLGVDVAATPSWDEVLAARADRVAQVRDYLAAVTPEDFAAPAGMPPWEDGYPEEVRRSMTVARCLGVIGNEEWEHLRFAVRDLDAAESPR